MKKSLILFLYIISSCTSIAGNYISGDISYIHLSNNNYGIKVRTLTFDTTLVDSCFIMIYFGDGDSVLSPRINGNSISCPPSHDGQSTPFTFTWYSEYYVEHSYMNVGDYFVTTKFLKHIDGLVNITNSGTISPIMNAEILVNPSLGYNNSVVYTSYPISRDTVNTHYNFISYTSNSDNDSLYYELLSPNGGYTIPASSNFFVINSSTGLVEWDSPIITGQYNFTYKINEWRNIGGLSYYVGSTMQEVWAEINGALSINETMKDNQIKISPNPNNGQMTLSYHLAQAAELSIYDMQGRRLITYTLPPNNQTLNLNLDELNSGIYYYSIHTKDKQLKTEKLVIVK